VLRLDGDRYAVLLLLNDDLESVLEQGLAEHSFQAILEGGAIQEHLTNTLTALTQKDALAGLVLFVLGGVGRGFVFPRLLLPNGWWLCGLTMPSCLDLA
jgi:hypothetical protein